MADSKYGRVFTESDLEKILEWLEHNGIGYDGSVMNADSILKAMDEEGIRFKFADDTEPLFILRGRDKRALGTVRHYRDNQARNAPSNNLDACDKAVRLFEDYRNMSPEKMKEPD